MDPLLLAQATGPAQELAWFQSPLVPLGAVLLIFYFLILRPNANRQKEHQKLLEGLDKGTRVVTTGGLVGTVVGTKGELVSLKLGDNVKVEMIKTNVASLYEAKKPQKKGEG